MEEKLHNQEKTGISDTFYKNNVLQLLNKIKSSEDEGLFNQKYEEQHLLEQTNKINEQLEKISDHLRTIKKCVIFFTVIAAIGIVSSVIISLL